MEESAAHKHGVVASISSIPDHILTDIFTKLPVKSVSRCRSVCKNWYDCLSSPNFIKLHFDRSHFCPLFSHQTSESSRELYLSEEDSYGDVNYSQFNIAPLMVSDLTDQGFYDIVNSCNGFLCLHVASSEYPVVIYNPVTGEYLLLMRDDTTMPRNGSVLGFGYCRMSDRYKILFLKENNFSCSGCDDSSDCRAKTVFVYTLGSGGGWRKVKTNPCVHFCKLEYTAPSTPVLLNDALHWPVCGPDKIKSILSFDLEGETFRMLPVPLDYTSVALGMKLGCSCPISLGIVRGQLCTSYINSFNYTVEFWVMKEYGVVESWVKEYEFFFVPWESPLLRFGQELSYIENSELLTHSPLSTSFYFIDGNNVISDLNNYNDPDYKCQIFSYVPSFFPLKDITGDAQRVLNVRPTEMRISCSSRGTIAEC